VAEKETEFTFYAGPLLTSEELKAAQAHELDDEVEFVSPRVPGRMQRGASTPPRREGRGRMSARSQMRLATEEDLQRDFGSERLLIGFPVRPPSSSDQAPTAEPPAEEERPVSS